MTLVRLIFGCTFGFFAYIGGTAVATAQVPPSSAETANYTGLLAAAARGDAAGIRALVAKGEKPDVKDGCGRTPLHVAAFGRHHDAMRALVAAGANPNALENDRYDIVTIAAVANDVPTLTRGARAGGERQKRHQPLRRHRADRRRPSGPRGGRPNAHPGGGTAGSRQQSGLDGAHRIHRARRWRPTPHRDAEGAGGGRGEPEPGRSHRTDTAVRSRVRAGMRRWSAAPQGAGAR